MKIFLATTNQAKIQRYKNLFSTIAQEINEEILCITPTDLGLADSDIAETGKTEIENATIKAKAFWDQLPEDQKMPCLGIDTGTYFEGVSDEDQPGLRSRGITGAQSNHDAEDGKIMTSFYQNLARKYGGEIEGYYLDGHCLYSGEQTHTIENKRPFVLTGEVVGEISIGMPMLNLWKSKIFNKHGAILTPEENKRELSPISEAIKTLEFFTAGNHTF